jgi:hypothetical protein
VSLEAAPFVIAGAAGPVDGWATAGARSAGALSVGAAGGGSRNVSD